MIGEKGVLKFSELFSSATSRPEVICTFLALLELIRLKQLICVQAADFEEIEITRAKPVVEAPFHPPRETDRNPNLNRNNPD